MWGKDVEGHCNYLFPSAGSNKQLLPNLYLVWVSTHPIKLASHCCMVKHGTPSLARWKRGSGKVETWLSLWPGGNVALARWKLGFGQVETWLWPGGNVALARWKLGSGQVETWLWPGGNVALARWKRGSGQVETWL